MFRCLNDLAGDLNMHRLINRMVLTKHIAFRSEINPHDRLPTKGGLAIKTVYQAFSSAKIS